jgi:septal ring factor EnvC (AmiA/AmiB activator)
MVSWKKAMTLKDIFSTIWPFIVTILVASVPSIWALVLASRHYTKEGGRDEQLSKLSQEAFDTATKAAGFASGCQEKLNEQILRNEKIDEILREMRAQHRSDAHKIDEQNAKIEEQNKKIQEQETEISKLKEQLQLLQQEKKN